MDLMAAETGKILGLSAGQLEAISKVIFSSRNNMRRLPDLSAHIIMPWPGKKEAGKHG